MEKYSLNEGNESLKRILLMMSYDNKKTLDENCKNIFEQDNIPVVNQDEDNALDPKIVAAASSTETPSADVTTPKVSLSYEDTVKKLQNLLITKYQANLGKSGADGKIGKLTLDAIASAISAKFAKQPPTTTDADKVPSTNTGETPLKNDGITDDSTPTNNTQVQGQIQSTISDDEEV
jgi:hypothetical protein